MEKNGLTIWKKLLHRQV